MTMRFEQVRDDDGAERWHALEARAVPFDHPGLLGDPLEEVRFWASGRQRSERCVLVLAVHDGEDVGSASMWLPERDNRENATVLFSIDPARRRRGLGTQFAAHLVERARDEGRRHVLGFVGSPVDGPEGPGALVAKRLGAKPVLEVARRCLDVETLDLAALDAVLSTEGVAEHATGYDLVTWVDRVPDALADGAARLLGRMSTDAPMGEVTWEAEVWDAARYREREVDAQGQGRTRLVAGAVERASGELVAYTDVGISRHQPSIAYQWDTIVDPAHRGHRLGVLIKVANLRQLRERSPETRRLYTYNALSNEHMVAINDRLGFEMVERSTHWELTL